MVDMLLTLLFCLDVVEDVFKIGSVQPGAVLFDSLKEFDVCLLLFKILL
jgi:hypothetical protein